MEFLTGLGYSIIALAMLVGIGIVLLGTFANSVAGCSTIGAGTATYNASSGLCTNATGSTANPSTATVQLNAINEYLGTGSGGLATWIPLIIIAVIGMWFLGAFLARRGKNAA